MQLCDHRLVQYSKIQITKQETFNMKIFVENRFVKFQDKDIAKEAWEYQFSPQETDEESFFEGETTYYSGATVDYEQTRRMVNRQYVCRQNRPRHASFLSFELFSFVLPSPLFFPPLLKSPKDTSVVSVCHALFKMGNLSESLRATNAIFALIFPHS